MNEWKCLRCGKVIGKRHPNKITSEKCFCKDCLEQLNKTEDGIQGFYRAMYSTYFDKMSN